MKTPCRKTPLPQRPATPPAQLRPNHRKFQPKSPPNACYFHATLVLLCCYLRATQSLPFASPKELSSRCFSLFWPRRELRPAKPAQAGFVLFAKRSRCVASTAGTPVGPTHLR